MKKSWIFVVRTMAAIVSILLLLILIIKLTSYVYSLPTGGRQSEAALSAHGSGEPVIERQLELMIPPKEIMLQVVEDTRCPEPPERTLFPSIIASGKAVQLKDFLGECVYNKLYKLATR